MSERLAMLLRLRNEARREGLWTTYRELTKRIEEARKSEPVSDDE